MTIPASAPAQNDIAPADEYEVSFLAQHEQTVQVKAQLTLTDSLLYMSNAGPVPERWPQYIRHLKVLDEKGRGLPLKNASEGGWILPGRGPGERIHLEYELSLTHEAANWPGGIDGVAFQRDWGTFCTGRALFVMNGREKPGGIRVRFQLPEGWRVSTPWTPAGEDGRVWKTANPTSLSESLLFAGTHEELIVERGGITLKFALGGERAARRKTVFAERAEQLIDYYAGVMGGLPQPPPDDALSTVMVVINESEKMDGEVIGNHISMFMGPEGDPQAELMGWFLFAHEFFHLWNGKTLRVSGTTADWFKEGVTNYYTLKAMYQTGFIDEAGVAAVLNNLFYQRYINDPGLGDLSIAEAASTFRKDKHWGLVYGGGLFAGIALDMIIREHTDNEQSLDVLMRRFYKEYGGTDRTYGTDDVIAEASRLSGRDLRPFAGNYITGTDRTPLEAYLAHAGIMVETGNDQLRLTLKEDPTELEAEIRAGFLGRQGQ